MNTTNFPDSISERLASSSRYFEEERKLGNPLYDLSFASKRTHEVGKKVQYCQLIVLVDKFPAPGRRRIAQFS